MPSNLMAGQNKEERKKTMSRVINKITARDRSLTSERRDRIHRDIFRAIEEDEKKVLEIKRELKLNYSKQFFVRFPRDMEKILGLKRGKKIRFSIVIPLKEKERKPKIQLEVVDGKE